MYSVTPPEGMGREGKGQREQVGMLISGFQRGRTAASPQFGNMLKADCPFLPNRPPVPYIFIMICMKRYRPTPIIVKLSHYMRRGWARRV